MRRKRRELVPVLQLRLTLAQRLTIVWGMILGGCAGELIGMISTGGAVYLSAMLHAMIPVAAGGCLALPFGGNYGADLTPHHIDVRGLRNRRIPWDRIVGIHIEKTVLGRRVVIYEADGRRTRLRAPLSGFLSWDRRFEEKFHAIERQWIAARSLEPSDAIPLR